MFQLAQTAWPRFGGNQANRSLLRIAGPHTAPHWQAIPLLMLEETPEHMQRTRIGSLNNRSSAFFNSDREQIGAYRHAAKFAVYPDGGWVALSKQHLARLTIDGKNAVVLQEI